MDLRRARCRSQLLDGEPAAIVRRLLALTAPGRIAGPSQTFTLTRDWIGTSSPVDRDTALAELAGRYLAGHGPATTVSLELFGRAPRTAFESEIDDVARFEGRNRG